MKQSPARIALAVVAAGALLAGCGSGSETETKTTPAVQTTASGQPAGSSAAVARYRRYVKAESDELVTQTQAFVAALRAGQLDRARTLFGPARIHYEAIEPIAESFGDLDPEIDARVNDVAKRSQWTGFHRIEQILWVKGTTRGTERYATKLLADVRKLDGSIEGLDLRAVGISNGAVELLDEVASSKITGEEDRYSHTDLSDFQGNLDGALAAFSAVKPMLVARGDSEFAADVERQFAAVQKGLDRYKRSTPLGFALYSDLSAADRRRFAQQITTITEPLSLVGAKLVGS